MAIGLRAVLPATAPAWYEALLPGQYATLGGLVLGVAEITPAAAAAILRDRCGKNRAVCPSTVESLARDLLAGNFPLTGEPLIFDLEHLLIQGRHRLTACVRSETTFGSVVVLGVGADVFEVLDQHRRRNARQVMEMNGVQNHQIAPSAVSFTETFAKTGRFERRAGHHVHLTIREVLAAYACRPGLAESVAIVAHAHPHLGKLFTSPGLASAIHYAFASADREAADAFFEALRTKQIPKSWDAVSLLTNRLVENMSSRAKLPVGFVGALAVKAWNAVVTGRPCAVLRYGATEEYPRVEGLEYTEDGRPVLAIAEG